MEKSKYAILHTKILQFHRNRLSEAEALAFDKAVEMNPFLLFEFNLPSTMSVQHKFATNTADFLSMDAKSRERELTRLSENARDLAKWIKIIVAAGGRVPEHLGDVSLPEDPKPLRAIVTACTWKLHTNFVYALAIAVRSLLVLFCL